MAMPAGAAVVADKNPSSWHSHCYQPPQMDEREGFFMWLRGEFAAANAIIDALCTHLRAVGEPGEYDGVIGCIQQRRSNWNPILHMQQYFSVAEVIWSLQQVGWRRQQRAVISDGGARKDTKTGDRDRVQNSGGEVNEKDLKNAHLKTCLSLDDKSDEEGDEPNMEEKYEGNDRKELDEKSEVDSLVKKSGSTQEAVAHKEDKSEVAESCNADGSRSTLKEKQNGEVTPKTFVATEICDGRPVNVVDGMKLYEELIDNSEITKLATLVNDLRASGRLGKLQGQTFVISKRPMKGHGREMIHFGHPSSDTPSEGEATVKGLITEPIPALLQDVIERLLEKQVVGIKLDSCFIDIYNEGDHSQPYIWPQWYGRPVCVLFLTECEMSFGTVMAMDHPGDYRGAIRLSLSPGSMLVMQGRSADFTRHAIPSLRKQRILITFTKFQPNKFKSTDLPRFTPNNIRPPPKHIRPVGEQPHFVPIPPAGMVLPVSATPLPNGIQQVYLPMPVVQPALTFPHPTNAMIPPPIRHHHRLPLVPAGTGVFLPSQSSSNQLISTLETENVTFENDLKNMSSKVGSQGFDGKMDGTSTGVEHHQNDELSKATGAV